MTKLIDEIPADAEVIMTPDIKRAFLLADCDPKCHCCGSTIKIGAKFKLAYIKSLGRFKVAAMTGQKNKTKIEEDEMLCENCTPVMLIKYKKKLWKESEAEYESRYSGYTRAHV